MALITLIKLLRKSRKKRKPGTCMSCKFYDKGTDCNHPLAYVHHPDGSMEIRFNIFEMRQKTKYRWLAHILDRPCADMKLHEYPEKSNG